MNENLFETEFRIRIFQLLDQAVLKIDHCLDQLEDGEIWWRPSSEMNSIGNLLLHVSGNLAQWTTASIRNEPDRRNRASEFESHGDSSKQELRALVEHTVQQAKSAMNEFDICRLTESTQIQGFNVTFMEAWLHTACHFQGHTHQIILLTRLIKQTDYRFHWPFNAGDQQLPM